MAEEPTQSHTARFTPPRIDPAPKSCSDGAQELEGPHLSSLHLQRKRNSSLRDSLEQNGGGGGGGVGEGEVMGLVLQEADSTTIEHLSHPIQPSSSSLEQVSVLASSYRNSDPGVGGGANKQGGSGQSLEVKEESPQRVSQEKMEEEEGATVTPKKILCAETIGGGVSGMEGVASKVDTLGGRASGLEGRASGMETIEGGASGLETLGGGAGIEKGGGALGLGNDGSAQKMEACKEEATGQMEVTQGKGWGVHVLEITVPCLCIPIATIPYLDVCCHSYYIAPYLDLSSRKPNMENGFHGRWLTSVNRPDE